MKRDDLNVDAEKVREWQQASARRYAATATRKPLPRQSRKYAAAKRVYAKRRKAFLAAHPVCSGLPWIDMTGVRCGGLATEIHHQAGRIGSLLLDDTKWVGVCHRCHCWVTAHPAEAIQLGLSLPRVGVAS